MHAFTKRRKQQQKMVNNDMVSSEVINPAMVEQESSSEESIKNTNFENSDDKDNSKFCNESEEKSLEIDVSPETDENISENKAEGENEKNPSKKRSAEENICQVPSKKTRNKPKPQIIEDMKDYYEKDAVNKLSTATLRHWLKSHSIHCTTRDKKDILVEKVKNHFLDVIIIK